MMNKEVFHQNQLRCFSIISYVGSAKSNYMEALKKARNYEFEEARKLIEEGKEVFVEGHKIHAEMIAEESAGEVIETSLLMMHTEAQLIDAETCRMNTEEFLHIYECLAKGS